MSPNGGTPDRLSLHHDIALLPWSRPDDEPLATAPKSVKKSVLGSLLFVACVEPGTSFLVLLVGPSQDSPHD